MTRYATTQLLTAVAVSAVGLLAAAVRVGDALVTWASPR